MEDMPAKALPKVAWVLGDAAGIGPEIVAKSLAGPELGGVCRPVVVGPTWLLQRGMEAARVTFATTRCDPARAGELPAGTISVVDPGWPVTDFPPGMLSAAAGKLCMEMLRSAVDMARAGAVDAVVFAPLNKEALRLGGNPHADEHHLVAEWLGEPPCAEINVVGSLFTTRVTSHVPLRTSRRCCTRTRS
jgi:4-hydroxythreonine-4-phosphate dehydrogenase